MGKPNDLFAGGGGDDEPDRQASAPAPGRRGRRSAAGGRDTRRAAGRAARAQETGDGPENADARGEAGYTAADIEVLEGLEPVRRRPGMYIGGTDHKALHHLFAEVLDNAMDEVVAGHATAIDVRLDADNRLTVADNGRGIPVEPHPRFPDKSALEVIMTTLHAGGKFDSKAYEASGGLHGVGVSVVNALSEEVTVEVARGRRLWVQGFSRGHPTGPLQDRGAVMNRRGTTVSFRPDLEIFKGAARFEPGRVFRMARAKAYLFAGAEIRWSCDPALLEGEKDVPAEAVFRFPNGLGDFLAERLDGAARIHEAVFAGRAGAPGRAGSVEWAVGFVETDPFVGSYCNTIPTAEGGTHEQGLRSALVKGLKGHAERVGQKKAGQIASEDVAAITAGMLSVFVREPEFVGQTKDRLASAEATRLVEGAVRDAFDHWLAEDPARAGLLLEAAVEKADERARRRAEKDVARRSATRKLRLPGKLADCTANRAEGTEIFIVEGDSAGGSAKQARDRATQAVLPLRGKILNVASAGRDKIGANQQLADLVLALGCGVRRDFSLEKLRYERVIVMTDADVDGAHIASLLITFFYREMPDLIRGGHLYLAVPPLYKLTQGAKTLYARDERHRDALLETAFGVRGKVEVGRFKGLGEMMPAQLRETTMDRKTRTLLKVVIADEAEATKATVERLMGNRPEARFAFIQENAAFATTEALDI